jgi:sterol desaturase/sphingolipid hydroxylase (fatty acid hydroxylase superfamily)
MAFLEWNDSFDTAILVKAALDGLRLVVATVVLTVVLELFSLETVKGVWKQPGGSRLYTTAAALNLFNHFVLGIPLYVIAAVFFCSQQPVESHLEGLVQVMWVILAHSIQYYLIHKAFHESPRLYRLFHRFHHRFNTYVPPSSANAVTPGEYLLAYAIPFAVAVLLRRTHPTSLHIAACISTLTNLLVHTPKLEALSKRWVPSFLVSTNNHLDHHRKLSEHYASPIINVDNIIRYFSSTTTRNAKS